MEQQTFYAVLDEFGKLIAGPYENANKANATAKALARLDDPMRVIAYTVIATFGGTDASGN